MPTRDELNNAEANLKQAIADAAGRVSQTINDLKGQLSAGEPITQADLDDLQSDIEALGQIAPVDNPQPTPAPQPAPTP